VRISYENFCNLLINALLPHWLKCYKSYPLGIENLESVRLMKGKNGIHLDNQEHVILEHCVSPKDNKVLATELNILFFIESDYLECAEAHCANFEDGSHGNDFKADADVDVGLDMVRFFINNIKY
jgi:hypothetical protein